MSARGGRNNNILSRNPKLKNSKTGKLSSVSCIRKKEMKNSTSWTAHKSGNRFNRLNNSNLSNSFNARSLTSTGNVREEEEKKQSKCVKSEKMKGGQAVEVSGSPPTSPVLDCPLSKLSIFGKFNFSNGFENITLLTPSTTGKISKVNKIPLSKISLFERFVVPQPRSSAQSLKLRRKDLCKCARCGKFKISSSNISFFKMLKSGLGIEARRGRATCSSAMSASWRKPRAQQLCHLRAGQFRGGSSSIQLEPPPKICIWKTRCLLTSCQKEMNQWPGRKNDRK